MKGIRRYCTLTATPLRGGEEMAMGGRSGRWMNTNYPLACHNKWMLAVGVQKIGNFFPHICAINAIFIFES